METRGRRNERDLAVGWCIGCLRLKRWEPGDCEHQLHDSRPFVGWRWCAHSRPQATLVVWIEVKAKKMLKKRAWCDTGNWAILLPALGSGGRTWLSFGKWIILASGSTDHSHHPYMLPLHRNTMHEIWRNANFSHGFTTLHFYWTETFWSILQLPTHPYPTIYPPWALGVMCRSQAKLIFPPEVTQIVVSDHPSLWHHWTPCQYLCHACKQCVRKVKKFKSFTWFYNSKHFTDSKLSKKFAVFSPTYIHDSLLAVGTWV